MSGVDRDADLLMLAHGDLSGLRALRTRLHLAHCGSCRERFRDYAALSARLASGLRNPRLGTRTFGPSPRVWTSVGVLAVLLSLLGWLVATDVSASTPALAPPAAASCEAPRACPAPLPKKTVAEPNLQIDSCDR